MRLSKVSIFKSKVRRFCSRQYNFDENNGDYLRKNWSRLGQNLSFADERFYFRQPLCHRGKYKMYFALENE